MKQDTKRFSSIIFAGLLLAGALIVYFEFIIPSYGNLEMLKGQVESEQQLYGNEKQISTNVNSLLASYNSNSSTSQLVDMALPVGEDLSGALAQVYGLAQNSNVTVQSTGISVQAVQAATGGSTAPTAPPGGSGLAAAASTGSIIKPTGSISIQISGTGSYESIKSFLQGLESNIRIFDVTGMTLQPASGPDTKTGATQDLFTYSLTATTYYQAQ